MSQARRQVLTYMVLCAVGLAIAPRPAHAYDQALVAAAKKEGQVTWYTTQIIDQFARPAAQRFESEFGVKVSYVRADSAEVAMRQINEEHAGKVLADVFDGTDAVVPLERDNLVLKWLPEAASHWPKDLHDPNGYWTATNLYVLTPAYNTSLVQPGGQPRTWDDLLDPKWKGKMAWNAKPTSSGGPGFVGLVLTTLGEDKGMDYLRRLSKQNIAGLGVSARQVLDQTIAGEYAIALQIFNNHAVISASKGAPTDWIAMNPASALFSEVSILQAASHPNAAKLLVEFLTSTEGQKLYRDADYIPVAPDVQPKTPALRPDGETFKAIYFTPERIESSMPKWAEIAKQLFR